ncbi:DUF4259 domain-containing protein [Actinacidiphila glaucinigra]|uniref:DUF4259 domain-containing protein n=1 Tax=Actinacidiphila glaucinigra TaxID=235986 RepID=UPI0038635EF1
MSTCESGPFDGDTAEDFLDELKDRPTAQRLAVVERTLRTGIEAGVSASPSVLPKENRDDLALQRASDSALTT